jgi:hypothetical protein
MHALPVSGPAANLSPGGEQISGTRPADGKPRIVENHNLRKADPLTRANSRRKVEAPPPSPRPDRTQHLAPHIRRSKSGIS